MKSVFSEINDFTPEGKHQYINDCSINNFIEYATDSRFLFALIVLSKQECIFDNACKQRIYAQMSDKLISHVSLPVCGKDLTSFCSKKIEARGKCDYEVTISGYHQTSGPDLQ